MVGLLDVLHGLRWWHHDANSRRGDPGQERRPGVPAVGEHAGVQHAKLPGQLSSECVVGVVGVLQDVRRRGANADPRGDGGGSQRWGLVPGIVAGAAMQHAGLPRQLRRVGVVGVVGVHQAVWHGRANAHPDRDDAAGLRWHGVPVAGGIAAVQHTGLPDSLCGVGVDGLVLVLQVVWHGCAIANPLGHHATGLRRRGVPRVGAIAAVQRPEMPRELCGGLVVVVVEVQPVVWRRRANANALGGDPRGVRWRGMPGPYAVTGVQHAQLPRQLCDGLVVGMVGVL